MGQDKSTDQPNKPAFWRDPRLYQIISLSTLLLYGLFWLHFDVSVWQVAITLGIAQLTQYAGTRYFNLPSFDPKSALISSLSLCLLLRTNDLAVAALAVFITIGSKFVLRWKNKHVFNPTNFALVVILNSGLGWISPGQWGQVAWLGFLIACLGSLVVTRRHGRMSRWPFSHSTSVSYSLGLCGSAIHWRFHCTRSKVEPC